MEEWRDVVGWAGLYEVSNLGRVRSLSRKCCRGRVLRPTRNVWGCYYAVDLSNKTVGRKARFYVHRLVAVAFVPNPLALPEVNHLNGAKTDNSVINLEWATASQNAKHASLHGLMARGESQGLAKLTEQEVVAIRREFRSGFTQTEIAARYGVCRSTIDRVARKKTWRHLL